MYPQSFINMFLMSGRSVSEMIINDTASVALREGGATKERQRNRE